MTTLWRAIAHHLILVQPFIPTYIHLLISALFPIVAGSHASLSRPTSAAAPLNRSNEPPPNGAELEDDEDEHGPTEKTQHMEGWTPSDVIVYPILMTCALTALYFVLKWLEDPDIVNQILNLYLSAFGIFSIAKLVTDSVNIGISLLFPRTYVDQGIQWEVKQSQRLAFPRRGTDSQSAAGIQRSSPLPGPLSRIDIPGAVAKYLWASRSITVQPAFYIRTCVHGMMEASTSLRPQDVLGLLLSLAATLYFNFLDKPWWLTNILGLSFCYEALQIISPTNFYTGTLVLLALFMYDIYFVFFTPLMITVATSLDVPIKLLFPRPVNDLSSSQKQQFALLGLGDIVLPGIFIGLALRFDLYLFYLKGQASNSFLLKSKSDANVKSCDKHSKIAAEKFLYRTATGNWGERFWLGAKRDVRFNGGRFPKIYFRASVMGYLFGLLCTLTVMHIFKHGQPALLYLVPAVLSAVWGTAFCRGEIKQLWEYSEANEETPNTIQDGAIPHNNGSVNTVIEKTHQESPASPVAPKDTSARGYLGYIVIEKAGWIERARLARSTE